MDSTDVGHCALAHAAGGVHGGSQNPTSLLVVVPTLMTAVSSRNVGTAPPPSAQLRDLLLGHLHFPLREPHAMSHVTPHVTHPRPNAAPPRSHVVVSLFVMSDPQSLLNSGTLIIDHNVLLDGWLEWPPPHPPQFWP